MAETRVIERDGRRWRILSEAAEPLLAEGWPSDSPDNLHVVKQGRGRTVYRFECAGRGYYLKAYAADGLGRRLRALVGRGPARREWDALRAAAAAGLAVPQPVAVSLGAEESLITTEVPGARRLDEYLFDRYFAPLSGEPPYPGARPAELVAVFRDRRRPPAGTVAPKALAAALADLVARLSEADLFLPDLHPGNILISDSPQCGMRSAECGVEKRRAAGASLPFTPHSASILRSSGCAAAAAKDELRASHSPELPTLWLVDLARAVRPAPPQAVLEHLVRLEHFFEPIASVAERLRCLRRAGELLGGAPAAQTVCRETAAYRARFYRNRDRRTRRESKYFRRIRAGEWRGWATADSAETVERLLAQEDPLGLDAATPIKQGRTSGVWRINGLRPVRNAECGVRSEPQGNADAPMALYVKRHNRAAARLLGALRRSRSVAAFRLGHALLARGIATARPVGAADRRRAGRVVDTLLVTEPVGGPALPEWLRAGPSALERRQLARNLSRMLRRMHDAGFSHRDLKAPNVLVVEAPGVATAEPGYALAKPGVGPRPFLVDLDGLRPIRRVSERRRQRDLMRLSVSLDEWGVARQTDRLRFLRAYLGRAGCPSPITVRGRARGAAAPSEELRRWWHAIAAASERKRQALRRKRIAAGDSDQCGMRSAECGVTDKGAPERGAFLLRTPHSALRNKKSGSE